jgi:hypothetical protein
MCITSRTPIRQIMLTIHPHIITAIIAAIDTHHHYSTIIDQHEEEAYRSLHRIIIIITINSNMEQQSHPHRYISQRLLLVITLLCMLSPKWNPPMMSTNSNRLGNKLDLYQHPMISAAFHLISHQQIMAVEEPPRQPPTLLHLRYHLSSHPIIPYTARSCHLLRLVLSRKCNNLLPNRLVVKMISIWSFTPPDQLLHTVPSP